MKYIPQHKEARNTPDIIGDENLAVRMQRANIPKEEVVPFFQRFKKEALQKKLFSALSLKTLQGVGSTRQFLEEDFQKPYAGDLDLIIELGVGPKSMNKKVEELLAICQKCRIPHKQSFGNISLFFPVQQHVTPDTLVAQVDVMLAPKSPNSAMYHFMKNIRYFSAEPYAPTADSPSLKGVHTALLLEKVLSVHNILMDNAGLYRRHYVPELTKKIKKDLFGVLSEKKAGFKKISKKFRSHESGVQQWTQDGFPFPGEIVTHDNKKLLLPDNQNLYEEIADLIIERQYVENPYEFLRTEYNWSDIGTFAQGLDVVQGLYNNGTLTQQQVQDVFSQYAQRLGEKNKGVVRFPRLQNMITDAFPFVVFPEEENTDTN